MKKLTAGIFAGILTVVTFSSAHAEIASKGYVDARVDELDVTTTAQGAVLSTEDKVVTAIKEIDGKITAEGKTYDELKTAMNITDNDTPANWTETDNTSKAFIQNKPNVSNIIHPGLFISSLSQDKGDLKYSTNQLTGDISTATGDALLTAPMTAAVRNYHKNGQLQGLLVTTDANGALDVFDAEHYTRSPGTYVLTMSIASDNSKPVYYWENIERAGTSAHPYTDTEQPKNDDIASLGVRTPKAAKATTPAAAGTTPTSGTYTGGTDSSISREAGTSGRGGGGGVPAGDSTNM